ncbi:MAG: alpha/beta fold hydrolase [Thioalkalivibrionaceae bacterium]
MSKTMIVATSMGAMLVGLVIVLAVITAVGERAIERLYPPVGVEVSVGDERIHARVRGPDDAPGVLLIHGASSNLRDLDSSLGESLAEAGFRVVSVDRPGFGYSTRQPGRQFDPSAQAMILLDAAQALGLEKPIVIGHSWAGAIVMAALVEHRERVAGGVLIAGVTGHWAGSLGAAYEIAGLAWIGAGFARTLLLPVGWWVLDEAVESVAAPQPVPDGYAERIAARLALRPRTFLINAGDVERSNEFLQSLSPRYGSIDRPLMVIHGDADEIVPFWNHGERLAPIVPGIEIHLMPGVGHIPHHTNRAEVLRVLLPFLGRLSQPR